MRRVLDNEGDVSIVGEAMDGEEAVGKARELKPDVVLMDMDLPRIDGLEATRRTKEALPDTVVIMFSPLDGAEYRDAATRSGADDFLTKITPIAQILSTIRHWLPGKTAATSPLVKGQY